MCLDLGNARYVPFSKVKTTSLNSAGAPPRNKTQTFAGSTDLRKSYCLNWPYLQGRNHLRMTTRTNMDNSRHTGVAPLPISPQKALPHTGNLKALPSGATLRTILHHQEARPSQLLSLQ